MQQFSATGTYSDASTQDLTTAVTWSSSNTAAATIVTNTGAASTVASGTTTISAALGSVSGMTTLQVLAPDGISQSFLFPSSLGTLNCGESKTISGTLFPTNSAPLAENWLTITWSPDATCQANGFVMVPVVSASSPFDFNVFTNPGTNALAENAFDPGTYIDLVAGAAAGVRLPGTYYIEIEGVVTGTWTLLLNTIAFPQ